MKKTLIVIDMQNDQGGNNGRNEKRNWQCL